MDVAVVVAMTVAVSAAVAIAVAMFDTVALIMAVRMNATIVGDRDYACACGSGSGHSQRESLWAQWPSLGPLATL